MKGIFSNADAPPQPNTNQKEKMAVHSTFNSPDLILSYTFYFIGVFCNPVSVTGSSNVITCTVSSPIYAEPLSTVDPHPHGARRGADARGTSGSVSHSHACSYERDRSAIDRY